MKRYTAILICFIISIRLWANDTVLLDFESDVVPVSVSSWLNYASLGASASTWSIANPQLDAINNTPRCYKITKGISDPYWTGLEISLASPIAIDASNQYLHVYVYKNSMSRISLTFTPDVGNQSSDIWQSNDYSGVWIDYVLPITVGINLKKISIKIGDDAGDYYFDQVVLSNSPTSLSKTKVLINPTVKNQILEGWGGSLCWWANIMGGFSDSKIKTICDWIVDPINGLNMNIFRFNIGGGDDPVHNHMRTDGGNMPGYKVSLTSPYDWNQDENQRKILQQLINSRISKNGINDIQIIGFSNSPPYWMTRSGCTAGSIDGNVTNLKSDMFDDFADYLTEVVKHYHDSLGICFNYLEPFNEPDGTWWKAFANQEGCYFSTNDQINLIRELYTKLSDKNMLLYCHITANDANNIDNCFSAVGAYKSAGDILSKFTLLSVHTYGGSNRAGLAGWAKTNEKKLWQSESGPINITGTNEHQIMVVSDRIITDMRDLKCTAWHDWQIGGDGTTNAPWALIVNTYSNPLSPITKGMGFYIRAQYSRYLKPGYTIVYNSLNNALTAISPDEKELVIVLSNQNTYIQKYSFDLSKFFGLGKVKQIRTRVLESYNIKNSLSLFSITGNSFDYDAAAESVTTFVIPINQAVQGVSNVRDENENFFYSRGKLYTRFYESQMMSVSIYNSIGQLVKSFNNIASVGTYQLNLNKGYYIVDVNIGEKQLSKKILIN